MEFLDETFISRINAHIKAWIGEEGMSAERARVCDAIIAQEVTRDFDQIEWCCRDQLLASAMIYEQVRHELPDVCRRVHYAENCRTFRHKLDMVKKARRIVDTQPELTSEDDVWFATLAICRLEAFDEIKIVSCKDCARTFDTPCFPDDYALCDYPHLREAVCKARRERSAGREGFAGGFGRDDRDSQGKSEDGSATCESEFDVEVVEPRTLRKKKKQQRRRRKRRQQQRAPAQRR